MNCSNIFYNDTYYGYKYQPLFFVADDKNIKRFSRCREVARRDLAEIIISDKTPEFGLVADSYGRFADNLVNENIISSVWPELNKLERILGISESSYSTVECEIPAGERPINLVKFDLSDSWLVAPPVHDYLMLFLRRLITEKTTSKLTQFQIDSSGIDCANNRDKMSLNKIQPEKFPIAGWPDKKINWCSEVESKFPGINKKEAATNCCFYYGVSWLFKDREDTLKCSYNNLPHNLWPKIQD